MVHKRKRYMSGPGTAIKRRRLDELIKKKKRRFEAKLVPGLVDRALFGFPNSIITKLRYSDYVNMTSSSGGSTSYLFRANGINDPDYTGAGHQPMWRDNYAAAYDFYTVLGSKITVTFHSKDASHGFVIALVGSDTPTLSSTVSTWMEQNNSVGALIGNQNTEPKTLVWTYSPLRDLGQEVKDDGSSMTTVGADPSAGEGTFYYGLLAATDDGASTASLVAKVDIEYTVKFAYLSKQVQN